eukprot:TRINITY_DN571_c0_g2_i21.p1 TRINITY_DN571_c0_g2~~TRINITY_DN571_c0_g2_i21.p1  ORF type:complete len:121 (+),score=5.61 TRINITY_DN571_c0_g2_i21:99-461(+)
MDEKAFFFPSISSRWGGSYGNLGRTATEGVISSIGKQSGLVNTRCLYRLDLKRSFFGIRPHVPFPVSVIFLIHTEKSNPHFVLCRINGVEKITDGGNSTINVNGQRSSPFTKTVSITEEP